MVEMGLGAIHRMVFLGLKGGKRGVQQARKEWAESTAGDGGSPGRQRKRGIQGIVIGPVTESQIMWGQEIFKDLIHITWVCYQVIDPWPQVRKTGA